MVRKLYLLRHGEAVLHIGNEKDFERNLTYNGIQIIKQLSGHLKAENFKPEIVYSSTSYRTEQTTHFLFEGLKHEPEMVFLDSMYEASTRTLFEMVIGFDSLYHSILMVGHNPAISYLAEYLTGESIPGLSPGQLVKIEFGVGSWKEVSQGLGSLIN